MPFALLGVFLGLSQEPDLLSDPLGILRIFVLVILCMVFARSAAMAFNRYLDADIDAKNQRTKSREIPSGKITRARALGFTTLMSVLFVLSSFFINKTCFYLSPIALLVILGYSYTKRFTSLCHLILGLGLALAPIGAYIAVTQHSSTGIILLGLSVLFWVAGFDVIYSLQDRDFDSREDLHSIPVLLGVRGAIVFSRLVHLLSVMALVASLHQFGMLDNVFVIIALGFYVTMIISQHRLYTPTDYSSINKQYMTANGIASMVFCTFVILGIFIDLTI